METGGAFRHRRLEENAPKTGTARVLRLTEKRYSNIRIIVQGYDYQEEMDGIEPESIIRDVG